MASPRPTTNVFDQFDTPEAPKPPPSGPNPFDQFDPPAEAPPATTGNRVQAAEGGLLKGAAYLATQLGDVVPNIFNLGRAIVGTPYLMAGHAPPKWLDVNQEPSPIGHWLTTQMDKSPITTTQPDRPDDAVSRYLAAGASAIPGAGAASGGNIARFLATAGAAQVPMAAGQAVQEAHPFESDAANNAASIAAQLLAGQVGPTTAATTRGLLRGGEKGRQATVDTTNAFRAAGAEPSLGQATGNRGAQAVESGLSMLPGASGVMERAGSAQAAGIGAGARATVSELAPRGASVERAGRAIETGVTGEGGFRDQFQGNASRLYSEVDKYIPPESPIKVGNTVATLQRLDAPIAGAAKTSSVLSNPKIAEISKAIQSDAGETGTLPYNALAAIRTKVGTLLGSSELMSDIPRAQLKQLYGAISSDMEAAATARGPQASQAFSRASAYYKAGIGRLEALNGLVDRNAPEGIFNAAMSGTRDGATTLRATLQSLKPDEQRTVAATVLKRMGTAVASQQNESGDVFSPQTFLTNYNRMSAEAKTALFDRFPGLREKVDNIARVAGVVKGSSKVFANSSGTTPSGHMTTDLAKVLGAAGVIWHETGSGSAAAGTLGVAGLGNLAARAMTSPKVVDWAGRRTPWLGGGQQAGLLAAPANFSSDLNRRIATQLLNNQ
jgi:hypothetical protein